MVVFNHRVNGEGTEGTELEKLFITDNTDCADNADIFRTTIHQRHLRNQRISAIIFLHVLCASSALTVVKILAMQTKNPGSNQLPGCTATCMTVF